MSVILLVDDEESVRLALRRVLLSNGYQVLEASNGREALRVLEQESVDVLITDIFMPDMDGLELARHLRKSGRSVPKIIAISADGHGAIFAMATSLGASVTLDKPFTRDQLLAALASVGA